jgi:hypothetical protein
MVVFLLFFRTARRRNKKPRATVPTAFSDLKSAEIKTAGMRPRPDSFVKVSTGEQAQYDKGLSRHHSRYGHEQM